MNVRFADSAVRVRLSAADVEQLTLSGTAQCRVYLPPAIEWRCIMRTTDASAPDIVCTANTAGLQLVVEIPTTELARWQAVTGRARSLRTTVALPLLSGATDVPLSLIIEQDLHPKTERS